MAPGPNERILDAIHNRMGRWVTKFARDPVRTAVSSPEGGIPVAHRRLGRGPAKMQAEADKSASDETSEARPNLIKLPHGCLEPGYLHMGCSEGD